MEKRFKVELSRSEISALRHVTLVYWVGKGTAAQTKEEAKDLYYRFRALDNAERVKPSV